MKPIYLKISSDITGGGMWSTWMTIESRRDWTIHVYLCGGGARKGEERGGREGGGAPSWDSLTANNMSRRVA